MTPNDVAYFVRLWFMALLTFLYKQMQQDEIIGSLYRDGHFEIHVECLCFKGILGSFITNHAFFPETINKASSIIFYR